ncbi:MAG: hypothetical protein H7Y07_03650, partial [Pyrinomonadaceae bacterium]|nr:hypothetical protein [Sphingobacteriaceae bacterium]
MMCRSKILGVVTMFLFALPNLFGQDKLASVVLKDKSISIVQNSRTLLTIDSISFNFISQSTQSIILNSPDSIVIQLQYKNVPEFYRINIDRDYTENLTITRRNGVFHFYMNPKWARSFSIHLAESNDHYFGLMEGLYPDNRKSPDLRGQTIDVEVVGEATRLFENYASVWSAFYFNPKGYASFVNTFARGKYQLAINGKTSVFHDTGKLDWYIFTGDHQRIYESYYKVIGKPKFVPLWACGPIIWRDENNGGSAEILDDAKQFSNLKIPFTTLMVDRPYSNGGHQWSKMDFNSKFAKPEVWIKALKDTYGLEFITWIASATFTDKDFPGLLPGSFGYMDLSDAASVAEFGKRLKEHQYSNGVKGHKMDRADEQFPQGEAWKDKTPEFERRNKYVYLYTKVTDSLLKKSWGNDQFTFTRAGFHGSQPYLSGIWGGDVRTSWDGMAANLANAMRVSYMGFPNWGTDATGYSGTGIIP